MTTNKTNTNQFTFKKKPSKQIDDRIVSKLPKHHAVPSLGVARVLEDLQHAHHSAWLSTIKKVEKRVTKQCDMWNTMLILFGDVPWPLRLANSPLSFNRNSSRSGVDKTACKFVCDFQNCERTNGCFFLPLNVVLVQRDHLLKIENRHEIKQINKILVRKYKPGVNKLCTKSKNQKSNQKNNRIIKYHRCGVMPLKSDPARFTLSPPSNG